MSLHTYTITPAFIQYTFNNSPYAVLINILALVPAWETFNPSLKVNISTLSFTLTSSSPQNVFFFEFDGCCSLLINQPVINMIDLRVHFSSGFLNRDSSALVLCQLLGDVGGNLGLRVIHGPFRNNIFPSNWSSSLADIPDVPTVAASNSSICAFVIASTSLPILYPLIPNPNPLNPSLISSFSVRTTASSVPCLGCGRFCGGFLWGCRGGFVRRSGWRCRWRGGAIWGLWGVVLRQILSAWPPWTYTALT